MQLIDLIETYAFEKTKDLVWKEEIKCDNIIKHDDITKGSIAIHIQNWPHIPGHLYKVLIIAGSSSGKKINCLI